MALFYRDTVHGAFYRLDLDRELSEVEADALAASGFEEIEDPGDVPVAVIEVD